MMLGFKKEVFSTLPKWLAVSSFKRFTQKCVDLTTSLHSKIRWRNKLEIKIKISKKNISYSCLKK